MSGWNVSQNLGAAIDIAGRNSVDELFTRLRTGSGGTQYFSRVKKKDANNKRNVDAGSLNCLKEVNVSVENKDSALVPIAEANPLISRSPLENGYRTKHTIQIYPMKRIAEADSKLWQRHGNNHLGLVLSALYAKLLVVCGTGFSLAEVISSYIPAAYYDGFYLYLYFMSIVFMTCILGNVIKEKARKHARNFAEGVSTLRSRKNSPSSIAETAKDIEANSTSLELKEVDKSSSEFSMSSSESFTPTPNEADTPPKAQRRRQRVKNLDLIVEKEIKEKGTHFGSFYLRMGAVAFGVGSMIYSGLEFGQYFELKPDEKCHSYMIALTPAVRMIFTFMQMYFIFLNSKMAVSKVSLSSQFGLMHMIGTNLCVWLNVLVQETKHEILNFYDFNNKTISFLYEKAHKAYLNIPHDSNNQLLPDSDIDDQSYDGHLSQTVIVPESHSRLPRGLKGPHSMYECGRTNIMGSIVQDAAPFLFPCTIEYSLICAAICYVMWKSMAKRRTARIHRKTNAETYVPISSRSPHHYTVDCARANKGLFVGIFFLVLTIMSIIINLVLDKREEYRDFADLEVNITEIVLYTSATIAVIIGMCQVRVLRYARQRNLELDNILLIVSQTGSLIFNVFTIISGQFKGEKLVLITALSKVIQLLMQTLFILDASNRAAATVDQAKRKPGREVVTFLLVTNLAMWLINALEKSRGESHPAQLQFYGVWGWTIITHISMPLAIFYRFHSTVCLCEIWKKAFKLKRSF